MEWKRNGGGQHYGGGGQGYRYWRGSWPHPQESVFPSYDQNRGRQQWDRASQGSGEPSATTSLVQMIQDALNGTRRCEQRVIALTEAKEERAKLWERYEIDLQKAYAKEFNKYNKDMQRREEDLARALVL